MSERSTVLLEHHLKELKLPTFLREYGKVAGQCAAEGVDHPGYLLRLSNCIPIVKEVKLGGICGARVTGQVSWPSDLPDGRIYLVEMRSVQGTYTGYRVIPPGSRYDELPDDQLLFDCWDLR